MRAEDAVDQGGQFIDEDAEFPHQAPRNAIRRGISPPKGWTRALRPAQHNEVTTAHGRNAQKWSVISLLPVEVEDPANLDLVL